MEKIYVLIVDDQDETRRLSRTVLELGIQDRNMEDTIEIHEATGYETGLDAYDRIKPDYVISDINFKGSPKTGIDLANTLVSERNHDAKRIMLSSAARIEEKQKARFQGEYVIVPNKFDIDLDLIVSPDRVCCSYSQPA
ncbi:response regulator [Candidatus Woesearchaeota archaeon]|nr:response regulator [Candidatus Woesearchaeota archaeon]